MKTKRYSSFFFCFICILIFCSTVFSSDLKIGIKASSNYSWLKKDYKNLYTAKNNLCGGLFYNTAINDKLNFQFEVLYSNKGAKFRPQPDSSGFSDYTGIYTFQDRIDIRYIELPFTFQYMIFSIPNFHPYCYLGGAVSLRINASLTEYRNNEKIDKRTINISNTNAFDYLIILGLGTDMNLLNSIFILDVRFEKSLNEIYFDTIYASPPEEFHNIGLSFSIGIIL